MIGEPVREPTGGRPFVEDGSHGRLRLPDEFRELPDRGIVCGPLVTLPELDAQHRVGLAVFANERFLRPPPFLWGSGTLLHVVGSSRFLVIGA